MSDVKYQITVDSTGALTSIKKLDDEFVNLNKTEKDLQKQQESMTTSGESMTASFVKGQLIVEALKKGLSVLVGFVKSSADAAIEAERAEAALGAAIDTTGRRMGTYLPVLNDHTKALARITTQDHEQIKASQALLLQLTDLDVNGIRKATEGAIGLASVFGMDLEGATTLVAKAMTGNMAALSRYGIKVDENLTLGQKQAALLEKLAPMYERAKMMTNTLGGALAQLSNAWHEIEKAVGGGLIANEEVIKIIKQVKDAALDLAESGDLQKWAASVAVVFVDAMRIAGKAVEGLILLVKFVEIGVYKLGEGVLKVGSWLAKLAASVPTTNASIALGLTAMAAEFDAWAASLNASSDKTIEEASKVVDAFEKLDALAKLIKSGFEAAADGTKKHAAASQTATKAHWQFVDVLRETGKAVKEDEDAVGSYIWLLRQLTPETKTINDVMKECDDALDAVAKRATKAGEELKVMTKSDVRDRIREIEDTLSRMGERLPYEEVKKLREELARLYAMQGGSTFAKLNDDVQQFATTARLALDGLNTLTAQAQRNKEIAIENEYKRRLDFINKNVKDEKKRGEAVEALEAEFQIKRTEAARASAKASKASALMGAIVNTAEGVTKMLASGFPPWNFINAAIVAAMGAAQVALIAKQPIPLARGTVFKRSTLLTSARGTTYEVGDGNEDEVLAPESKLRSVFRDVLTTPAYGGGLTLNINSPLIATTGLSQTDLERASSELFRQLERELRRRGR